MVVVSGVDWARQLLDEGREEVGITLYRLGEWILFVKALSAASSLRRPSIQCHRIKYDIHAVSIFTFSGASMGDSRFSSSNQNAMSRSQFSATVSYRGELTYYTLDRRPST